MTLQPDYVYLIPPDADLAVKGGQVVLTPRGARRAAAHAHRPPVPLSGRGPEEPRRRRRPVGRRHGRHPGPQGDQGGGRHHLRPGRKVGPPRQHAAQRHRRRLGRLRAAARERSPASCCASPAIPTPPIRTPADGPEARGSWTASSASCRGSSGVDFTQYKRTTITRRIRRRMALRGLESSAEYLQPAAGGPRRGAKPLPGPAHPRHPLLPRRGGLRGLKSEVFPALIGDRSPNRPSASGWPAAPPARKSTRWPSACWSSSAIATSTSPDQDPGHRRQRAALERRGRASTWTTSKSDVSAERLRRFFAKVDGHYQIGKAVRDLCVFSRHNLTSDPPFSRLDLVSCRNVLIYMDARLQKRRAAGPALRPEPRRLSLAGLLRNVGDASAICSPWSIPKHRIYTRNLAGNAPAGCDFGYTPSWRRRRRMPRRSPPTPPGCPGRAEGGRPGRPGPLRPGRASWWTRT